MSEQLQVLPPDNHALEVARSAFVALQRGAADGDWEAFHDLLTDDVRIEIPVHGFDGLNVGKERAREIWAKHHGQHHGGSKLEGKRVAANGSLVVIESRVEGVLGGQSVANGLVFIFEIAGDKVAAMYEYLIWSDMPDSSPWGDQTFGRDLFAGVEPAIPFEIAPTGSKL